MSDFFRTFAQLTGLIALSTMFAIVIVSCYLVLSVFLLGPLRVLRGALGHAEAGVGGIFAGDGERLEHLAERVGDWRHEHTTLHSFEDNPETPVAEQERASLLLILVDTLVFTVTMAATLLLLIISANLLGLRRWTGADSALPWLIGSAVLVVSAYAWSRLWYRRGWSMDRGAALIVFSLTVIAFLVLAVLRGIDVWIQQINEDNTMEAVAAGTAIAPPPAFLLDLRAGLPAATYFFAELAIIGGAALAHRGMLGLVGLVLIVGSLVIEGLVLLMSVAVRLVGFVLQLVLRVLAVAIDVLSYPPAALYRWLMRYDRIRGSLRLQPLPGDGELATPALAAPAVATLGAAERPALEPGADLDTTEEEAAAEDGDWSDLPGDEDEANAAALRAEPAFPDLRAREEPATAAMPPSPPNGLPEESAVRTIGELRGRRSE